MFHQFLCHHRTITPSALLFPAVDPHHRYLIHSTVQDHFPHLTSVSVGEGDQRRTAVSFRSAPSPPDSPLVGHIHPRDQGHKPPGTPHHDLDRRKECMQTITQPSKQAQHTQHTTHKQQQQQQQHPQHKTQQLDKPQNKVQQEAVRAPTDTRRSENQPRKEEKPQQTQHNAPQQQQSRQPPRYRSHSSSSSHSRHRHWRDSVSPHHRTDTHTDTPTQQGKPTPTPDDTHSKRRRNRKNKRLKDKTEQPQDNTNDHVNSDKQTLQNTEPGHVTGRGQVNPNGRVTRRAEWTNSAGVGEGGIRKKCKSVEAAAVSRSNTRGQSNSEECERRLCSGDSGGSLTTSPTRQHQGMPVTMPPETSNNRRRGKAAAQIYRPPPARGSHEEPIMSPAHHPHTPPHPRPGPQEPLGYHTYPVVGRQRTDSECSTATNASDFYGKSRGRRPDQVLYVPRGRRHGPPGSSGSARGTPIPLLDMEPLPRPPSPTYSICSVASEYSGQNRYGRQGSQASLFDGEMEGRVRGKPPQIKGETNGRESSGGNQKHHRGGWSGNNSRFSNETYQLIERCLNHDTDSAHSKDRPSPQDYHKSEGGRKSPAQPRDAQHSIHSKENIMGPQAESGRRSKKRRSRRRHSRSREPSAEHHTRGRGDQPPRPNTPSYGGQGREQRAGSCERVFYNSSYERQDRGYDNYDRYSSSRTSSRNPSLERTTPTIPNLNWRGGEGGGSNPITPNKGSPHYNPPRFRGSSGKPPSGRLGSLPNVALDFGESAGNTPVKDTTNHCHTLPVHLPSTHTHTHAHTEEENNTRTLPVTSTPSKDTHTDTHTHSLDTSMTSSLENGMVLLDTSDGESPSHSPRHSPIQSPIQSPDLTSPSKEYLNIQTHSPRPSCEPSPCSSPGEEGRVQDTPPHTTPTHTHTDHTPHTDHTHTDPIPTEAWDQNQPQETPEETPAQPSTPEEREEKKASKKFAFNWADEVEDSWDSLYDDSGECLDPDLKQQLNDTLGKVKLEKPVNDYCRFQARSEAEMNEDDYAHVIEIYDFPTSFKTQDIMMVFGQHLTKGFDIKWVDDSHALGIFSTSLMASEALNLQHPFLKTRSLSSATKTSRAKAMRITDALLPYKPRPATSATLARRLVSGALGLKVNISREVREAERQKLKDAKARKRLEAKQRVDAWEGNLT